MTGEGRTESTGVGLANIRDRLVQAYGDAQLFEIRTPPEGGFTVVIELPFEDLDSEEAASAGSPQVKPESMKPETAPAVKSTAQPPQTPLGTPPRLRAPDWIQNMTIRTIIVDDEKLAIQGLQLRLEAFDDIEIIETCANGREAIRKIKTEKPDLVFLDIQMPGFDGFCVVKGVMEIDPPLFVFVTAYQEHAIRAFEANAVNYLMKPVDDDKLADTVERVRVRLAEKRSAEEAEKLMNVLAEVAPDAAEEFADSEGESERTLRKADQREGSRADFPCRGRLDRTYRGRGRLHVHLHRRQLADPARNDEGSGTPPGPAQIPARPPLHDRQSRPGAAGEAAHQWRMLPGAG